MLDRRLVSAKHVKRIAQVVLVLLTMIAEGFFYSAHAQCAPTDKIYIDPRLVPQRPLFSREQTMSIMLNSDPATKQRMMDLILNQHQPIQMPFRDGIVLIHPQNPCIQQYLGK